ncbi:NINE protein [uncultured Acetatifactor sp.]
MTALLLCIFLGGFGIHRFYVGKIETWRLKKSSKPGKAI